MEVREAEPQGYVFAHCGSLDGGSVEVRFLFVKSKGERDGALAAFVDEGRRYGFAPSPSSTMPEDVLAWRLAKVDAMKQLIRALEGACAW